MIIKGVVRFSPRRHGGTEARRHGGTEARRTLQDVRSLMENDLPLPAALDPERAAERSRRTFLAALACTIADHRPIVSAGDDLEIFYLEFSQRWGFDGGQHLGFGVGAST